MRDVAIWFLVSLSVAAAAACRSDDEQADGVRASSSTVARAAPRGVPQISPPLDVKTPPPDAARTASGVRYKTLVAGGGVQPGSGDTVAVRYTGWRQRTGETFFTSSGREQPIAIDLAHAAPGFREALAVLHKADKAMLWLPAGQGSPEPVAYEVEIVDVVARSAVVGGPTPAATGEATPARGAARVPNG
jgi:hypothetical protein